MSKRHTKLAVLATATALATAGSGGMALAEEHNSDAEHCISLNRIDTSEVIDDQTIVFHMLGNKAYVNRLPHKCPGLDFEEAFMYRTSIGQLCDLDIVTVLVDAGFGFQSGASCGLGMFHPVSEAEARQMSRNE